MQYFSFVVKKIFFHGQDISWYIILLSNFPEIHWFIYPIIFQLRKPFPIGYVNIISIHLMVIIVNILAMPSFPSSLISYQGESNTLLLLRPCSLFILYFHLRPKDPDCSVHCSNPSFPLPGTVVQLPNVAAAASSEAPSPSFLSYYTPGSPYTQPHSLLLLLPLPPPMIYAPSALMAWPAPPCSLFLFFIFIRV